MKIFTKNHTTKDLYIGLPEAERETNIKARVKLENVFKDFLGVFPDIESGSFIITGRKGSGKSATGQIIYKQAKSNANQFCEYIQKSDIDLEEIVQFSENTDHKIQKEILFKWIILTRLLKLITQNEAVQDLKEIKIIKHFLVKNTGFVNIDKYEIKEILQTTGFEIAIEKLLQFFRFKAKDELQLKGTKAPFYKLIPHLEYIVKSILTSNNDLFQENSYTIIFDDLDIEFKADKDEHVDTLLNLIRIAKQYNNNLFSDNGINASVIILLRDDISDILIKKSADMSKVFSSYEVKLKWFEHDLHKKNENLTMLKKFVDSRISNALQTNKIECNGNPWDFLIANSGYNESSFKYVIDHTFHTPRDLILFFMDLNKYQFNIPLEFNEINILIGKYAGKIKGELDNALAIHFSIDEIDNIFLILRELSFKENFSLIDFEELSDKYEIKLSPLKTLEILFDYSIIGNTNEHNNMVYFKHREGNEEHFRIDIEKGFILHRILVIYFKNTNN